MSSINERHAFLWETPALLLPRLLHADLELALRPCDLLQQYRLFPSMVYWAAFAVPVVLTEAYSSAAAENSFTLLDAPFGPTGDVS